MFDFLFLVVPFSLIFAFTVESNYVILTESESIDSAEQAAVALSFLPYDSSAGEQQFEAQANDVYSAGMNEPHSSKMLTSTVYKLNGYRHELVELDMQPLSYLPFSRMNSLPETTLSSTGHYIRKDEGDDTVNITDVTIVLNTGKNYDEVGDGQDLKTLKNAIYEWSSDYLTNGKHPASGVTFFASKQRNYDEKYGCVSKLVVKADGYANIHYNEWYKSGLHLNAWDTASAIKKQLEDGTLGQFSPSEIDAIVAEAPNAADILTGKTESTAASTYTGNGIPPGQVDFDATLKYMFDANPRKVLDNGQVIYGAAVNADALYNNGENFIAYNTCHEPHMSEALYPFGQLVIPSAISVTASSLDKLKDVLQSVPDQRELGINPLEGILKGGETLANHNGHKKLLVFIGPVRASNETDTLVNAFTNADFCNKVADRFKEEGLDFNLVYLATGNGYNEQTALGLDKCMEKYNKSNFYVLAKRNKDDIKEYIKTVLNYYVD